MEHLLELVRRHLGAAWLEIVEELRENNALDDVAERIRRGDDAGAIQGVEAAAAKFADAQDAAFAHSADTAADALGDALGSVVHYDEENTRATAWAEANRADLVREVTQEQRDLIRRVIADGVKAGRNPREVAQDLHDSIGLTDAQAQVVANYRRSLETGDFADALSRELTDGRADRAVAAAQRAGRDLTSDQIDKMVEQYRQNWVRFRAETIARTEALRVAHQGTEELFRQAIDNGDVDADELVRTWHHTSSGHPRATHAEMNGQERGIGEPFTSGSGATLLYPGDPDAPPGDTINCRCCVSIELAA